MELAGLAPAGRWMESRALHCAAPLGDWPSRQRNDDQPASEAIFSCPTYLPGMIRVSGYGPALLFEGDAQGQFFL